MLDTLEQYFVYAEDEDARPVPFQGTFEPTVDVHHVELDLSFNWEKEEVIGKERLWISAYFEPQDTIALDARGFEIKQLKVNDDSVGFEYDGDQLLIALDSTLGKDDTVTVMLDYIARPSMLTTTGGTAITSDKGLYFIDPRNEQPDKPTQLWTQGETESNSAWFALVDKPNDKFTQEVFLTVDSNLKTLSNGAFIYSTLNGDGTRTDYWKQSLPHSGYLCMIAVGDFSIVKDTWNDIDVWYYVQEEYEPYARSIFGNTPEMLDFYSEILKTPYPWEKYHQIVVEDFVSGAMENTSAVVHGSFVARTDRELIDNDYEDVIAHELFHHWFGDLVTCESWAQITMNEGFATYGEYLWKEYKYGQAAADLHLQKDLAAYFREAQSKSVPLIRNHYHHADDVFDSHSYQKGGRVLHMLRHEIGDDAFFESLRLYLERHAFETVEEDDLRLAVEQVTGRDLRWFFDQWYHREQHPYVSAYYSRDTTNGHLLIHLSQDSSSIPFKFYLPFHYAREDGSIAKVNLWVDELNETYSVNVPANTAWYALNSDGALLGQLEEEKPTSVWANQATQSEHFFGRQWALNELSRKSPSNLAKVVPSFLEDEFWHHRWTALNMIKPYMAKQDSSLFQQIIHLVNDPKSTVRHQALAMADTLLTEGANPLFVQALQDSSMMVQQLALQILGERDPCSVLDFCDSLQQTGEHDFDSWLSRVFAQCGDESKEPFFYEALDRSTGIETMLLHTDLVDYVIRVNEPEMVDRAMEHLFESVQQNNSWWMTYSALDGLNKLHDFINKKIEVLERHSDLTNSETERLARWKNKRATISALLDEVRESEHTGEPKVYFREE